CYTTAGSTACESGGPGQTSLPAGSDNPTGPGVGYISCQLSSDDGTHFWSCQHNAPTKNDALLICKKTAGTGRLTCLATGPQRECTYHDVKCSISTPGHCVDNGSTTARPRDAQLSGDECN